MATRRIRPPLLGQDIELAVGPRSLDQAPYDVDRLFLACGNIPGQVEHECALIDVGRPRG